jgi:Transposase DDE domain
MKTLVIFSTILAKMGKTSKPFSKFLGVLVSVLLSGKGRNNFLNLSRWASICARTFSRNFRKSFDFSKFNGFLIDFFCPKETFIIAIDCSYIAKSGKNSYGLGKFWSGCLQKAVKGLEISVVALVSIESKVCFSVSTWQTPAHLENENRMDFYLRQLSENSIYLLKKTKYVVADGFYAKEKFLDKTTQLGFFVITKLRADANMTYIYTGEQKSRGRKRTNGGKVNWKEIENTFVYEGKTTEGDKMYSQVIWSMQWKRKIKVVYLQRESGGKIGYSLLSSTDIDLPADKILKYYQLRFQIEYLFRDAKQHLGLEDCQSTKQECLNFHFNAAMMTLNLARAESYSKGNKTFSLYDIKNHSFNEKQLENIIINLDLDLNTIKLHPNYDKIIRKGKIAA